MNACPVKLITANLTEKFAKIQGADSCVNVSLVFESMKPIVSVML